MSSAMWPSLTHLTINVQPPPDGRSADNLNATLVHLQRIIAAMPMLTKLTISDPRVILGMKDHVPSEIMKVLDLSELKNIVRSFCFSVNRWIF